MLSTRARGLNDSRCAPILRYRVRDVSCGVSGGVREIGVSPRRGYTNPVGYIPRSPPQSGIGVVPVAPARVGRMVTNVRWPVLGSVGLGPTCAFKVTGHKDPLSS